MHAQIDTQPLSRRQGVFHPAAKQTDGRPLFRGEMHFHGVGLVERGGAEETELVVARERRGREIARAQERAPAGRRVRNQPVPVESATVTPPVRVVCRTSVRLVSAVVDDVAGLVEQHSAPRGDDGIPDRTERGARGFDAFDCLIAQLDGAGDRVDSEFRAEPRRQPPADPAAEVEAPLPIDARLRRVPDRAVSSVSTPESRRTPSRSG